MPQLGDADDIIRSTVSCRWTCRLVETLKVWQVINNKHTSPLTFLFYLCPAPNLPLPPYSRPPIPVLFPLKTKSERDREREVLLLPTALLIID